MRNVNSHSHTFDYKVALFLLTWGTSGNDYVYSLKNIGTYGYMISCIKSLHNLLTFFYLKSVIFKIYMFLYFITFSSDCSTKGLFKINCVALTAMFLNLLVLIMVKE